LHDTIREQARNLLTRDGIVPDDAELDVRYLGQFASRADVYKHLSIIGSPHIDFEVWPYTHIDWRAAAAEVEEDADTDPLLVIDNHYFDAHFPDLNRD